MDEWTIDECIGYKHVYFSLYFHLLGSWCRVEYMMSTYKLWVRQYRVWNKATLCRRGSTRAVLSTSLPETRYSLANTAIIVTPPPSDWESDEWCSWEGCPCRSGWRLQREPRAFVLPTHSPDTHKLRDEDHSGGDIWTSGADYEVRSNRVINNCPALVDEWTIDECIVN